MRTHQGGIGPHVLLGAAAALLIAVTPAQGQRTRTVTFNVAVAGMARLQFSTSSLTFPDSNPDTVPQVAPTQGPVTITAKARATHNSTITLTVIAGDDLRSGVTTIPASTITWTATGPGFQGGTLNRTTAQTVATWVGSGIRSGAQHFAFQNLWTHPVGNYSLTMLYTLSAP